MRKEPHDSPRGTETLVRHVLSGTTMGTRWSAQFYAQKHLNLAEIEAALQLAVDRVDEQMSPWKEDSIISRLNAAPPGTFIDLPPESYEVILEALELNALTEGAFDPFVGEPVMAWGFGAAGPEPDAPRIETIARNWATTGRSVALEKDKRRLCRKSEVKLDLCGIAKGYGVDRLSEVLRAKGIARHLVAIDGELRAEGTRADGHGWAVAIEKPDETMRDVALTIEMADMAIATSGDYRHVRTLDGRKVSHTIDPQTGVPVDNRLASVTVLADTCMLADALATALMVMGEDRALVFAERNNLAALLIKTDGEGALRKVPTGRFAEMIGPSASF